MHPAKFCVEERIAMMRAAGVPVSTDDMKRVDDSIASSLKSLDAAVTGSLFDTEPQAFDRILRDNAKAVRS